MIGVFALGFARAMAQSEEGSGGGSSNAWSDFASNYANWDATKILWMLATLAMAYAVATFFFLVLLGRRNPNLAAKYALFWGALSLILIHFFAFSVLLGTGLEPWMIAAIIIAILVIVWLVLLLKRRKR